MAAPITRSTNPAIREVSRGLVQASDERILRVVTMLDAMPHRGEADQVLAPLRPRLARLRPPRPLRFARLLFLPLDPLIVPAGRWRPEHLTLPRTAIPPIAAMVESALGPIGASVAAMIQGHTTRDHAILEEAGSLLWHAASTLLADPPPAAGWDRTGLALSVYAPMGRRIGALLAQAHRLRDLVNDAAQGLAPPMVASSRRWWSMFWHWNRPYRRCWWRCSWRACPTRVRC